MIEDSHFLRETVVDIDAAVVGIGNSRWTALLESEATEQLAMKIMEEQRFDTLPVESGSGIKEYYQTVNWNDYSSITRHTLTHRDVVPFKTSLRNVIRGFASESRHFYFLSNERRVVGLITVANLNCRQVKIYLFSLVSELEIRLGRFVSKRCEDGELLEMTFGNSDNPKYAVVKKKYHSNKSTGVDLPFVEYLYLSDLVKVIAKKRLFGELGFESKNQFYAVFNPLITLRNDSAHPNNSIVTDADSCQKLWKNIDQVEQLLFELR